MKKIAPFLFTLALFAQNCGNPPQEMTQTSEQKTYSFLVGSYTENPTHGVYLLEFSPNSFGLKSTVLIDSIQNPSFVIANKDNDMVFALEEIAIENSGRVMSYSQNSDGSLTPISMANTFGGAPCYLALSPNEDYLVAGNYSGGNLTIYSIMANGDLKHVQTLEHEGSSVNTSRQEAPHVHSTVFDREGKYLLAADLGTDEVRVYGFDKETPKPLSLKEIIKMDPGDGPRHSVFSPNGEEVIVLQELTGKLNVYSYDEGALILTQRLDLLDEDYAGAIGAAEVRYSPDGKFVYASNRGDANTLSVFSKNESGQYQRIQQISSGGIMPRNFNLTSDGKYLLSAHQASNDIVVFERNVETGLLQPTTFKIELNSPIYLFGLN